jgi:hypothetical protein
MAESVDAADLKSAGRKTVGVQVSLPPSPPSVPWRLRRLQGRCLRMSNRGPFGVSPAVTPSVHAASTSDVTILSKPWAAWGGGLALGQWELAIGDLHPQGCPHLPLGRAAAQWGSSYRGVRCLGARPDRVHRSSLPAPTTRCRLRPRRGRPPTTVAAVPPRTGATPENGRQRNPQGEGVGVDGDLIVASYSCDRPFAERHSHGRLAPM